MSRIRIETPIHITLKAGSIVIESEDAPVEPTQEEQAAPPSVRLDTAKPTTGLDMLRMRGAPVEMIYSALVAEEYDVADSMVRTVILEYLHDTVSSQYPDVTIRFLPSTALHATEPDNADEEYLFLRLEEPQQPLSLGTIPTDAPPPPVDASDARLAFLEELEVQVQKSITDDGNAAVLTCVEELLRDVLSTVNDATKNLVKQHVTLNIVPSLSEAAVTVENAEVSMSVSLASVIYTTPQN